jgi:predicted DsbA family dithiol-disulfide isomerase
MTTTLHIENFTDPACPWAFSAEPALLALRWRYGDQLAITPRMVVLSESADEYVAKGFTPDKLSAGLRMIQARFGMPIDTAPRARMRGTIAACRAVVAVRRHDAPGADALLRRLRVAAMSGAPLDDDATIGAAAREAGLDPAAVRAWSAEPQTESELRADMDAARHPLPAALALDHKLAGWSGGRRYTCPSLVVLRDGAEPLVAPGFQPVEVYEALIANAAPELERRGKPSSVEELLAWVPWPPATQEVAAVLEIDAEAARTQLEAAGAVAEPLGPDAFWRAADAEQRAAA